ncbi:MAG: hypothetical protein HZC13_07720 [Nitrospirae bacterium]|nr:hypothetical protein [Nitrospirota bacterium]
MALVVVLGSGVTLAQEKVDSRMGCMMGNMMGKMMNMEMMSGKMMMGSGIKPEKDMMDLCPAMTSKDETAMSEMMDQCQRMMGKATTGSPEGCCKLQ